MENPEAYQFNEISNTLPRCKSILFYYYKLHAVYSTINEYWLSYERQINSCAGMYLHSAAIILYCSVQSMV